MSTNLNIRIDEDVKKAAEKLFKELGLNTSTAVNMFFKQAIRENGLPFEARIYEPNAATKEAINEAKRIAQDRNAKSYGSFDDLLNEIL